MVNLHTVVLTKKCCFVFTVANRVSRFVIGYITACVHGCAKYSKNKKYSVAK
jgi:hypothetical protein